MSAKTTREQIVEAADDLFYRQASGSLLRKIACPSPARCREPHRQ
jgi:hypothetical protein